MKGSELVGRRLPAAVRLLRRHAERVPGAGRRLRVDRGGHRRRPHGAGLRRGRPDRLQRGRHPDDLSDGRARAVHRAGDRLGRPARVRRQRRRDPAAQDRRRRRAPRHVQPLVPALLALRPAARLPRDLVVVRARSPSSATGWSSSTSRSAGCPSTSRTAASASGSPTRATGRSAATASGGRRSRCGRATSRSTRGPTSTARSPSSRPTSASPVNDLHRPAVDELVRVNPDDPTGRSTMRRVPQVLDCWFESGSMPFAQVHYPFENAEWFEHHYPGDFIVEYMAQTRGLVLHDARARHGAVRPSGVLELREPRHRARRRRAQDVEVAAATIPTRW